jgi:hypothetical protein
MGYLQWTTCYNISNPNIWTEHPKLFQNNNNMYFKWLNIGICDTTSFSLNSDQNCHILIACNNMYTMKLKDELVFLDFFFHPIFFCCLQLILYATYSSSVKEF